jgi:hypothetical protein
MPAPRHLSSRRHPPAAAHRPFRNVALYWKSPLALLRGELIDRAIADADWGADEAQEAPHLGWTGRDVGRGPESRGLTRPALWLYGRAP